MTYKSDYFDDKNYLMKVTRYCNIDWNGHQDWKIFSGYIVWSNNDDSSDPVLNYDFEMQEVFRYDDWRLLTEEELLNKIIPEEL